MSTKTAICAKLSKAVYSNDIPKNIGIQEFERIQDKRTDTFATAYITDDTVYIAVRGSESRKDWLNDFKIIKSRFFGVKAHRGFSECAGSIHEKAAAILRAFPDHKPVFTGHSLGEAIAVLLAVSMRPNPVEIITFGQPRVATESELKLALYGEYVRVVNGSDLVPRSPWLGYSHAGTCLYLSNTGKKKIDPSAPARFFDRLFTFSERATDHSMNSYLQGVVS